MSRAVLGRRVSMPLWAMMLLCVIFLHNLSLVMFLTGHDGDITNNELDITTSSSSDRSSLRNLFLQDETNVAIPRNGDGSPMNLEDRLRYLELKTNSFLNFGTDPFFGSTATSPSCRESSNLEEFGCKVKGGKCPGLFDHRICLDNLPTPRTIDESKKSNEENGRTPPCLIYDFGVREQPEFGAVMANTFGCEVHAFDPSPVSTGWWEGNSVTAKQLRESTPNYHFHPYGAGGVDGIITLKEYNWGQVSILRYPSWTVNCEGKTKTDKHCKLDHHSSKSFRLPVKTLPTIMKELGHEGRIIDILKIDVEGSEYSFLQNLFDSTAGCPSFIQQMTLEWHHFWFDASYGEGSSPSINTIATLLHACGLKNFWQHSEGGWPAADKIYPDLGMKDVRYNLASFHREGGNDAAGGGGDDDDDDDGEMEDR